MTSWPATKRHGSLHAQRGLRRVCAVGLFVAAILAPPSHAGAAELDRVLAIDVSPSVDAGEFKLQMAGYAAAFRDRDMLRAVNSIGDAGIAVSVVLWGGPRDHVTAID